MNKINLTFEQIKEIRQKGSITKKQFKQLKETGKCDITEEQTNFSKKFDDYFVNYGQFVTTEEVNTLLQISQHFLNNEQLKVLYTIISFLN